MTIYLQIHIRSRSHPLYFSLRLTRFSLPLLSSACRLFPRNERNNLSSILHGNHLNVYGKPTGEKKRGQIKWFLLYAVCYHFDDCCSMHNLRSHAVPPFARWHAVYVKFVVFFFLPLVLYLLNEDAKQGDCMANGEVEMWERCCINLAYKGELNEY